MIRFCDMEVDIVEYASLTRRDLLDYFLPDHKDNILLVYESFSMTEYIGFITYDSFQHAINIDGAIRCEYIIFEVDMWWKARKYFEFYDECSFNYLLPVFGQDGQLLCFAYEDAVADREMRMLRELQKMREGGLQFSDIYSEYKCVRIYEFNELAFFFARYLEVQGVIVEVFGSMWRGIFSGGVNARRQIMNVCQSTQKELTEKGATGRKIY